MSEKIILNQLECLKYYRESGLKEIWGGIPDWTLVQKRHKYIVFVRKRFIEQNLQEL